VVDVHVRAPERVDDADEAFEVDVDDRVQRQLREHFLLDRFRRQQHRALGAAEPAADRVGGVDLFVCVHLAAGGDDVDHQVAGDRQDRSLALFGVEADEQDRVAVGRIGAVEDVLRAFAPVRAEDQERLRPTAVFGRYEAPGGAHLVDRREHLFGDAVDLVQRDRRRGAAAQRDDREAGEQEASPRPPPAPCGVLVV
jgi:hypothetical protein